MKTVIRFIAVLILGILLCWPTYALTIDLPTAGENGTPMDNIEPAESDAISTNTLDSGDRAEVSKTNNEAETPVKQDVSNAPNLPPATSHTENAVRSIVGSTVEIINIGGLDVPLEGTPDGFVYIPFVDIASDAYYAEAVAWAYSNDITAGVTELSFGPNQTCTRGQMVTFLWRAAGCPEPTGTASAFSDVTAGAYYEKAVAWAVENGITDGVGDGRFDPNGIVNRAQAVTFLYRAKGKPAATSEAQFTDVAAGEYYADAVAWAVANGITNGVSDNSFAPNANCVRGQTVTFLYRAYK